MNIPCWIQWKEAEFFSSRQAKSASVISNQNRCTFGPRDQGQLPRFLAATLSVFRTPEKLLTWGGVHHVIRAIYQENHEVVYTKYTTLHRCLAPPFHESRWQKPTGSSRNQSRRTGASHHKSTDDKVAKANLITGA